MLQCFIPANFKGNFITMVCLIWYGNLVKVKNTKRAKARRKGKKFLDLAYTSWHTVN